MHVHVCVCVWYAFQACFGDAEPALPILEVCLQDLKSLKRREKENRERQRNELRDCKREEEGRDVGREKRGERERRGERKEG